MCTFLNSPAENLHDISLGIIITLLFVGLLVTFCMILIKLYVNKIKTSAKALNTAIHETQEHVLNGISQDLHDDAGQQLTYINFQIENLKLDSPEMQSALDPISESVARLSASVRNISHSLNNQLLLQQDLVKAIKSEVDRMSQLSNIDITFEGDAMSRDFGHNEKTIIYRIFQEAISNCLKHAKAAKIVITIQSRPFLMSISDDGCGFDTNQNNKKTLGLQGMASRARIIRYHLEVISKTGNGTTLTLKENN